MNYVIEDDINFFDLLKKNTHDDKNDVCLISGSVLDENHITLECSHKFNYVPLYNEIKEKKLSYNPNNFKRLKPYQLECPYCRKTINKLIPYIPKYKGVEKINGVNNPKEYCMKCNDCEWIFKSGKQKDKPCNKNAFHSEFGLLCETHWKNKLKTSKKKELLNSIIWTDELEKSYKANTVKSLHVLLKEKGLSIAGSKKELVNRLYINK